MEITPITRDELKQKIDNSEEFILLDTLGSDSYRKAHIPGAQSIEGDADDMLDQVAKIVPSKDTEVVVHCSSFSCGLSPRVATKLMEAGYTNVKDFEGGLQDWAQGGYNFEGEEAVERKETLAAAGVVH